MAGPRHAPSPARQTAPALSYVAIAALGILVVLAAATPIPWSLTTRFEPLNAARNYTPTPLPNSGTLAPEESVDERVVPAWTGTVFWALIFLALALAALWLVRHLWRLRPRRLLHVAPESGSVPLGQELKNPDAEALHRGARTALDLLDEIADPQDAVIRSWLALEQAAEVSGAPRRPADSPTEFAGRVLRSTAAEPEAVTRLLDLYHRARFSDHAVGMAEVKQARACVLSLCRTWSGYENALRSSVQERRSVTVPPGSRP